MTEYLIGLAFRLAHFLHPWAYRGLSAVFAFTGLVHAAIAGETRYTFSAVLSTAIAALQFVCAWRMAKIAAAPTGTPPRGLEKI